MIKCEKSDIEVLIDAKKHIEKPEHWVKKVFFKNVHGGNDYMKCACAEGAILYAIDSKDPLIRVDDSKFINVRRLVSRNLSRFNDAESTTHDDIMAAFDVAIKLEKKNIMLEYNPTSFFKVPLTWNHIGKHYYSNEADYTLVQFEDGFLVDFEDLSLGHGYTLEKAMEVANNHYQDN